MAKIYRRVRKKSNYVSKGTGRSHQIRERRKPRQLTEKQKLYRETKNLVNEVNRRLRNLDREGYQGTWSSGKLLDRLTTGKLKKTSILKSGKYGKKITVPKDASVSKLIAIHSASKMFMESKTSTAKGIKSTRKSVIESLGTNYDIPDEMAEVLYNMFDNTDMEDLSKYSNASVVWGNVVDFLQKDIGELDLIDRLQKYANIDYVHDKDMRDKVHGMLDYLKKHRK